MSVEKYLHVIEFILTAIGIVALAIAALGIANALLAAVRERRREIGVMKAIGARDKDVMRTFLIEAGFLGLLGGIAGTVIGVVIFIVIGDIANSYLTSQGLRGSHHLDLGHPSRSGARGNGCVRTRRCRPSTPGVAPVGARGRGGVMRRCSSGPSHW